MHTSGITLDVDNLSSTMVVTKNNTNIYGITPGFLFPNPISLIVCDSILIDAALYEHDVILVTILLLKCSILMQNTGNKRAIHQCYCIWSFSNNLPIKSKLL